ncbi:FHA domain-containing protein [Chloroflexota bacterium]
MTSQPYLLIDQDGTQYPIGAAGLSLGRNRSNDVVIQDPKVSRRHAQILWGEGSCWIRDENSSAGVFVNGVRVAGQQKLNPGDQIQVGMKTFQLSAPGGATGAVTAANKKNQVIVWVAGAAIVILLLGVLFGGGFGVDMSRFIRPSETPTEAVAVAQPQEVASLTPTVLSTGLPSDTPAPVYSATIRCEDIDQALAMRQCHVTNTSGYQDTLYISFQPYRLRDTNDFNLSILLGNSDEPLFPERKGLISLGGFDPGQTKNFTLQMFCVNVDQGCPHTTIHVQLHAEDAAIEIVGLDGEFDIQNGVAVIQPTRTRKPSNKPQPTDGPQPAHTNTPSDAVGPTPTP